MAAPYAGRSVETWGPNDRRDCVLARITRATVHALTGDSKQWTAPCRRCGQPIDHSASTIGRRREHCHSCIPSRSAPAVVQLHDLLADPATTPLLHSVLARSAGLAEAAGWPPKTVGTLLAALHRILNRRKDGLPVRRSEVQAALRTTVSTTLAAAVLDEHGVLDDDTVPTLHAWIDRKSDELPAGFRDQARAWLLELHAGGARTRPRSRSTIYAYFGRVQPHLIAWSQSYQHLREVTEQDITDVLNSQQGHQRAGTFTSLRSLFRFAHRQRLVFTDPTRRLHVGRAPKRSIMPMTDDAIAAVKRAAVTPVQRLVVALVAVYAARATAIRQLTLDDLDLSRRRIRIGGAVHPMPDLAHRLLLHWLTQRQRLWPHTSNRHVLLSVGSAAGTTPVSNYYLTWHLAMQDVPLEHLRADRVLHEALAVDADPLHLATAFTLSVQTAIDYSEIAKNLLPRPIEDQAADTTR